jgi:hypothetical protein
MNAPVAATSSAQSPNPCRSNRVSSFSISASLAARSSVLGKNRKVSGSPFSSANGARSDSRHRRSTSRSVSSRSKRAATAPSCDRRLPVRLAGSRTPMDNSSKDREDDVATDDALANSRDTGGGDSQDGDAGSTTGTGHSEEFVGRTAGQDLGYAGETGAEARSEANRRADPDRP